MTNPLTYKQICGIMQEEELRGGTNRNKQLKRWQQYYDIEKNGKYYYIIKKYNDDELQLIENHGKYTTYIENILIHKLSQINEQEISLTYRELFEGLFMVNKDYYKAKYRKHDYFEQINCPSIKNKEDIIESNMGLFFGISSRLLKRILDDSIKSMENRKLLVTHKSFRLYKKENNMIISHDCTNEEIIKITEIQNRIMEKYNLYKIQQSYQLDWYTRNQFYDDINETIRKEMGYSFYCNSIRFLLSNEALKRTYQKSLNGEKLNNNIQNKLLTSKEMEIISKSLNEQFVNKFIKLKE